MRGWRECFPFSIFLKARVGFERVSSGVGRFSLIIEDEMDLSTCLKSMLTCMKSILFSDERKGRSFGSLPKKERIFKQLSLHHGTSILFTGKRSASTVKGFSRLVV